ncbi:MAG: DNA primase [Eubacterium sp.]|nr:DNA primase [Eubacterium sp.]
MYYSDDIIEEVRSGNDIVDVISGYVRLKRRGSSWVGLCPFHNEKTPSFTVSRDRQMYYCFGCGQGGNVYTFLMQYENRTFQEAVQTLAERAGVQLPEEHYSASERRAADKRTKLLEIQKEAATYYYQKLRRPEGRRAMQYLTDRALSRETIRQFGLGYADKYSNDLYRYLTQKGYDDQLLAESGLFFMDEQKGAHDKFWNRVMFPIMDPSGRVIGFGGRVMGDGKPKYLNSPETQIFDKSRNLYGLQIARRSRKRDMIVCEGYMDVISMHQAGFTNAVASLGTALTSGHCSLLKRYADRILLLYDSDDAGVRAALRAIPMLREAGLASRVVHLEPYKDPDEFIKNRGPDAFAERLEQAENSFMFEIRMLERDYDLHDPRGKSDFLHAAAAHLLTLEDEIERDSHLDAVAHQYRVERETLRKMVGKLALSGAGRVPAREPVKARPAEKQNRRDTQSDQAQKLLITWLANEPGLTGQLRGILSPEEFTNPFYRTIAELLYGNEAGEPVNPASIIDHFEDSEAQSRAAALFHGEIGPEDEQGRVRALTDMVCQIKKDALDQKLSELSMTDLEGLMKLTEARRKLDQLQAAGLQSVTFAT